jgi:hypothetical protein
MSNERYLKPYTACLLLFVTIVVVLAASSSVRAADGADGYSYVSESISSMPMAFTENQGQWDDRVLFRANAGGATMWFTQDGAYYQFTRRIPGENTDADDTFDPMRDRIDRELDSLESIMIKAAFVGANPSPRMIGQELMEYRCNYFIGNDPDKWRTDVPNYQAVVYEGIYEGIDLKYYGNGKQMEYDFVVSPGADPSQILVQYEGTKSLSINDAGELVVETDWGEVVEQRPVVYQLVDGDRITLAGEYLMKGDKSFGFALPNGYNTDLPLVIDPTLEYSTYLGAVDFDEGHAIAADGAGCAYVTGGTFSPGFPTENPYQTYQAALDVFVTKLSSSGNSLVYSTYLGGSSEEWGWGIAVDKAGCAFVTGETYSSDFPTENPYQSDQGYGDAFITKLSSSGSSLVYSTYLGGGSGDEGHAIAVDEAGRVYVTGETISPDFPTENPCQTDQGYADVFVTKLSSSGSSLVYSTYLGGEYIDVSSGIAVDEAGCAYVTGGTISPDFPTENPYQTDQGDTDVFVTKLSSSGSSLVYSTYLGGGDTDVGRGITVDKAGCAFVMGDTRSSDFPTVNPYQTDQGSSDIFVAKFSSSGSFLVYSTYVGGVSQEWGYGIAVDDARCAYVTGYTLSSDFPTENPFQVDHQGGYEDAFVTKLNSTGSSLVYSTYLGGSSGEWGWGIAVDEAGCAYVTGLTRSSDFPTENPYQADYQGGVEDVFVVKMTHECCGLYTGGLTGNCNCSSDGKLTLTDITTLIDHVYISRVPLCCHANGNVDGSANCELTLSDITTLIDAVYISKTPPADCMPECET